MLFRGIKKKKTVNEGSLRFEELLIMLRTNTSNYLMFCWNSSDVRTEKQST
jgi:hypothetical protein